MIFLHMPQRSAVVAALAVLPLLLLPLSCGPSVDADIPAGCGDGELTTSEECEGFELRGENCVSQGFENGQLQCNADCTLDVVGSCWTCGDEQVSGDEVCDGVAEDTCATEGFLGGTLRCEGTCMDYDTSLCQEGAPGDPCVEGECSASAFCLEAIVLNGCIARCTQPGDCDSDEECRAVDGESFQICAPAVGGVGDGTNLCSPTCTSEGCFACPAPSTCENLQLLNGVEYGECTPA